MNERTAVLLGAMAGAIVGGAFGFLYLTERGRRLRDDLEPRLADLSGELGRAWEAAERARTAVQNPWPRASERDDAGRLRRP